ncbi:hypothetical protein GCM10022233_79920 [Streptomyces shaanxiensis]|uniref:Uncharacterized protein n=1 Tax=Streptomyces shaanxiensis TaxID=653357 RepID=A0ABP7WBU9_9ACTN
MVRKRVAAAVSAYGISVMEVIEGHTDSRRATAAKEEEEGVLVWGLRSKHGTSPFELRIIQWTIAPMVRIEDHPTLPSTEP